MARSKNCWGTIMRHEPRADNSQADPAQAIVGKSTDATRVLILGPTRQDALFCVQILTEESIDATICESLHELCQRAQEGAGAALVPEEFLSADHVDTLHQLLNNQPTWSDFPLIVLLNSSHPTTHELERLLLLGNVTLVSRPVRIAAFVNTVRAKLRDRKRQFAVRDLLIQQKAASEATRRDERRLQMALRAGGMAAWEWSKDSVYWSERLYELLGYDTSITPSFDAVQRRLHPADLESASEAWTKAVENDIAFEMECRITHDADGVRWLAVVGEPVRSRSGKTLRYTGLVFDITGRKQAEMREKRQAATDHFLSEASGILTSSLDSKKTLSRITQLCVPKLAECAFFDLLGADGTANRVHVAHVDPDPEIMRLVQSGAPRADMNDYPPAQAIYANRSVLASNVDADDLSQRALTPEHKTAIQRVRPTSLISVPLAIRGETFGALTLIRTIQSEPYDEFDLRLAEELARRATAAIDNAQLYEAGQLANAAKSEFLANMSHEIRTPMTAIMGYTDLLMADETDETHAGYLATVKRNGVYLLTLINDILDLSKIEAGKLELANRELSLTELLGEVNELMSVRADEKEIPLRIDCAADLPKRIIADPIRLKQVLVNLVGNAIKFTESGEVRVTISNDPHQHGSLLFEVSDTGIGMSPAQTTKLFQPFTQGGAEVTQQYGGSGLGLAISSRLVQMFGGEISVESQLERGSVFRFTIPVQAVNSNEADELIISNSESTAGTAAPRLEKIDGYVLVVDDRRDIRFLSKHFLTKAGARVSEVEDGQEAVEAVEAGMRNDSTPDLILLDMQMPRLNGYDVAQRLRGMGFDRPIIALTADAMQEDIDRAIACGCNAHLSKPIDSDCLISMVQRFIHA